MAHAGFTFDDDMARSLRTIEHQRSLKRVAVFGGMLAVLIAFAVAILYGYADKPVIEPPAQTTTTQMR